MSNIGYRVTNIPLVPEIEIPKELFMIDPSKIFALVMDPKRLAEVRKQRIHSLGIPHDSDYADIERINKELAYCNFVVERLNCISIDMTHMSIEEASDIIKNSIDKRKG